jgi:hypothetical protein
VAALWWQDGTAIRLATSLVFVIVLLAPALEAEFGWLRVPPVTENRARVVAPSDVLWNDLADGGQTARAFEKAFDDNYALRDAFIRLENQVQYSALRDSRQVVIGRDGWLADRSSVEVQQRKVDQMSDEEFSKLTARILSLNERLKQSGVTLVLLPVPIKNTVYPEEFPQPRVVRPEPTGIGRLGTFLKDHPEVASVDVFGTLAQHRLERDVYYRTDLHWTEFGASLVAEQTVNLLAELSGSPLRWDTPRDGQTTTLVGSESDSMAVLWPPTDQAFMLGRNWTECGEFAADTPLPYFGKYLSHCGDQRLPKTLLVGNSFLLVLPDTGFDHYFSEIEGLHDLTYFPQLLTLIPPDTKFVVWEFFELEIGYQLQQDSWWAQVDEGP